MSKNLKNVLIIAATSDMAQKLIKKLSDDNVEIYAGSRNILSLDLPNLHKFSLDVSDSKSIENFFSNLDNVLFDAVICFQGLAIVSPVEFLSEDELLRQLNVSTFSLLNILKKIKNKIRKNGLVINISSMSGFGIFPFLAPYSISKASSDILLACYEIETGIKTVSIKPGVVSTKFWKYCIDENKDNFSAFKGEYENAGKFLINNARKNANKGIHPDKVSDLIYKILYSKNPKFSYTIGKDAKIAAFFSLFKGRTLLKAVRKILNKRIKGYINDR